MGHELENQAAMEAEIGADSEIIPTIMCLFEVPNIVRRSSSAQSAYSFSQVSLIFY